MAGKDHNQPPKHTRRKKTTSPDLPSADTEQTTLLEIKREINGALKDLFVDHDERLAKLESLLFAPEQRTTTKYPKAPEHCYN